MKSLLSLIVAVFVAKSALAQTVWTIDGSHSDISFSVSHLVVSEATGRFKKFEGELKAKSDDFVDADVSLTIDAASIDTDDDKRDGHLRSPDFFDVAKFPAITFKSKSFKKVEGNRYKLAGDLTMRGVTKPVELDVIFKGMAKSPWGHSVSAFKVTGAINRTDFGLTWNKTLEAGGLLVGEIVNFSANIELVKKS
ncbi:MAG: YceI family protein [Chloroherpetonaceae bacterium]|nr:YceI family protein [Chloroherpetonaceae bacterium]MDW8437611.1 YceI family protein [Chloroherpetonaceae bacterium]